MCSLLGIFYIQIPAVTHRNSRFYHHNGAGINSLNKIYNLFDTMCIKEIFHRVIVSWSGYYYKICISIRLCAIQCRLQIQFFLCKIFLYKLVLNRRNTTVYLINLFRNDIYCRHMIMLRKKYGYAQSNISRTCNCYVISFHKEIQFMHTLNAKITKVSETTSV